MANIQSQRRPGVNSALALTALVLVAAGSIVGLIAIFGKKSGDSESSSAAPADILNNKKALRVADETAEFQFDEAAAKKLQSSDFKFEKSGLKIRIPQSFSVSMSRKLGADYDEATFRDASAPESDEQSAPLIYIQISRVPEQHWNSAIADLTMNIVRGAIPDIRRKGIEINRREGNWQCQIHGVKFVRQEADGKSKSGRLDRYVFYCGASKPYLIQAQCCCKPEQIAELLPVMEASIASMKR